MNSNEWFIISMSMMFSCIVIIVIDDFKYYVLRFVEHRHMFKKVGVVFGATLVLLLGSTVYASDDTDSIKDYCSGLYKSDHTMIRYCYDNQIKAYHSVDKSYSHYIDKYIIDGVSQLEDMGNDPEAMIIINCLDRWNVDEYRTYNFPLVKYCIEGQFRDYNYLKTFK